MSTTITGSIKTIATGIPGTNSFVRFVLRGASGTQPTVVGTGAIAPLQGGNGLFYSDIAADGSGNVSGTIYSTRDAAGTGGGDITVAGSTTAVWYEMFVYANGVPGPSVSIHAKNGVTIDISNVTAISVPVVVAAPTGDTTYGRLDGGNGPFISLSVKNLEGVRFADQFATLNAAVADLPSSGGCVMLSPNTTYTVTSTISIAHTGISIKGAGHSSTISVNHTSDVFQVSTALFSLEDCEVSIATASSRSGSAIVNANNAAAQQGLISNVRFIGNGSNANNGDIFLTATPGVGLWNMEKIRFPGGVSWNSAVKLSSNTGTTVASNQFSNFVGSAKWLDAAFVFDGSIDTVQVSNIDIPGPSGSNPIIHCRNTVGGSINPRWIFFNNSSIECSGGTAIKLDTVKTFFYQGYVASCNTGVTDGSGTVANVVFSNTQFVNIATNAVALTNGLNIVGTSVAFCKFEDCANGSNNATDIISIAANVSDFEIIGCFFRSPGLVLARYAINIAAGTTNGYRIAFNDFTGTYGTGIINNGASGGSASIWGNSPNTIQEKFANGVTGNGALTMNSAIVARSGIQNDGGDLALTASTTNQTLQNASLTSINVGSGTAITKIKVYSQSLTPASVNAATSAEQSFTVTGVTTADKIHFNPPVQSTSAIPVYAYVSGADTVKIGFINPTAGALTPSSGTYLFIAFRS